MKSRLTMARQCTNSMDLCELRTRISPNASAMHSRTRLVSTYPGDCIAWYDNITEATCRRNTGEAHARILQIRLGPLEVCDTSGRGTTGQTEWGQLSGVKDPASREAVRIQRVVRAGQWAPVPSHSTELEAHRGGCIDRSLCAYKQTERLAFISEVPSPRLELL